MTKPTTLPAGKYLILLGNGASPEIFAAPCGLTTKGFNQSKSVQETVVPDCDNPDAAAYVERGVDSISGEISGSGVLALEAFDTWRLAFESGGSINCRIKLDQVGLGGYYQGAFVMTQFNMTAQRGQKINVDVTLQSDGAYTWTDM